MLLGYCVFLIPLGAQAGGYFIPDVGTVALGRGAAFVARADDNTAFYYNPAGLTKSTGVDVLLGGSLVDLNVDFLRQGTGADNPDDDWIYLTDQMEDYGLEIGNPTLDYTDGVGQERPYETVSNQEPISPAGISFIINWGNAFKTKGLSLSAGIFAPSGAAVRYPKEGAQRYALIKQKADYMFFYGVGVAYAFNRYFKIGGVLLNGMISGEQIRAVRSSAKPGDTSFNEDVFRDAFLTTPYEDFFMPTGVVGVLSNPFDWLEIGASVMFPTKMVGGGKIHYEAPVAEPDAVVVEGHDTHESEQRFPWIVRAGIRYIHRVFDLEADFVWEDWSICSYTVTKFDWWVDHNGLEVEPQPDPSADDNVIPDYVRHKYFRDTYSVRVGSDIEVWPENVTVRLGGYWESSHYPEDNRTFTVETPYAEKFGTGLGLTMHLFDALDLSLAYMHIFQPRVEVTKGILQQGGGQEWDPVEDLDNPDDDRGIFILGNTVNNGRYEVSYDIFSASVEGHF